MSVEKIDVPTADGIMDVSLHAPPAGNGSPAPTVIMYPDAGGPRPVMQEMAARLASAGYVVALPNILYRAGAFEPFDLATVFTDPAERARLASIAATAEPVAVMRDTGALLAVLAARPGARVDQVGCLGYCLGGRLAFAAAGAHPDRVAAAASIHGGHLAADQPTSPHRQARSVRAALYFGIADKDPTCTPESQTLLTAALDEAGLDYRLERYPGALHGFAVVDNPTYDEAAAEKHWERVLSLFAGTLPAGTGAAGTGAAPPASAVAWDSRRDSFGAGADEYDATAPPGAPT